MPILGVPQLGIPGVHGMAAQRIGDRLDVGAPDQRHDRVAVYQHSIELLDYFAALLDVTSTAEFCH